jgi:hypothetical protein
MTGAEFDIMTAISQVGFPIAVASYCLYVLNKSIKENTEILKEVKILLQDRGND